MGQQTIQINIKTTEGIKNKLIKGSRCENLSLSAFLIKYGLAAVDNNWQSWMRRAGIVGHNGEMPMIEKIESHPSGTLTVDFAPPLGVTVENIQDRLLLLSSISGVRYIVCRNNQSGSGLRLLCNSINPLETEYPIAEHIDAITQSPAAGYPNLDWVLGVDDSGDYVIIESPRYAGDTVEPHIFVGGQGHLEILQSMLMQLGLNNDSSDVQFAVLDHNQALHNVSNSSYIYKCKEEPTDESHQKDNYRLDDITEEMFIALMDDICGIQTKTTPQKWNCPSAAHLDFNASVTTFATQQGIMQWKCFGCGMHGDAVDLFMTTNNSTRSSALETLQSYLRSKSVNQNVTIRADVFLDSIIQIMRERYDIFSAHPSKPQNLEEARLCALRGDMDSSELLMPYLFVVVPELAGYFLGTTTLLGYESRYAKLSILARTARAAGIYLVLGSNYPTTQLLPFNIRIHCKTIGLNVPNETTSWLLIERSGLEQITDERRGVALSEGRHTEFMAFNLPSRMYSP